MPEHVTGRPPYQNGYHALTAQRPPAPTRQFPPPWSVPPPMPVMRSPMPLPPTRRRRTAVVLAALATAFLLAAGVFAALFVAASGDHDTTMAQADQRRGELADLDDRVAASDAERQRTERHNSGLESANADLTDCVDAMRDYLVDGLTEAQRVDALDAAFAVCR